MGIRIDIGLDVDGNHRFLWERSSDPRSLDIPDSLLHRWSAERSALCEAQARWQTVVEEIEEFLFTAGSAGVAKTQSAAAPVVAHLRRGKKPLKKSG